MIVSHSHEFIFFHNPKCAGTSFRDVLTPYHDDSFVFWGVFDAPYFQNDIDHTHLRLWELHAQFSRIFSCAERYNSVVFVRDPFARFLSAVNEHMKKFQPHIDLAAMPAARRIGVIEHFIGTILTVSRIITDWRFIHFSPQIWYLELAGRRIPRHVIPIEADGSFARKALAVLGLPNVAMPRHNPSPIDLSVLRDSPVITSFVREFYAQDFAFLLADEALAGAVSTHP